MATGNECCKSVGPGYGTPLDAMAGPKEALIYVTCVYTGNCLLTDSLFFFLFFFPSFSWSDMVVYDVCNNGFGCNFSGLLFESLF